MCFTLTCAFALLSSCVKSPPQQTDNICAIFKQYPSWYRDTHRTEQKWAVPIAVQMAIIHQESRFNGKALPARTKLLWVIPWTRPSTAYGYSQALKSTWSHYKQEHGGYFSSRTSFADAVDFIGWYAQQAQKRAGISPRNAQQLYLAYHEGVGGFLQKTYSKKPWLIAVAKKVQARSDTFQRQLNGCRGKFS
ncbi:MAG: transglycosylase SLT domain-containing protein [Legionellaceae bacterium]|nr:transglycosylase SLT domain-containing protein [Legionellaceae bacterium]